MMNPNVKFDKEEHSELFNLAAEILKFKSGERDSLELAELESLEFEVRSAIKECEEI